MRKKHFASRRSSVLIAPHGCLSEVALKHHLLRKQIWLKTSHWRGLYHDVIWHAGSDREAMQIAQCFAAKNIDKRIRTVPMAPPATIHKFIKNEYNENFATTDIRKPCELKLIYFGRISKEKNLSFAVHLLNQFCEEHPEVKVSYDLIGPIEGEERFIQEIMDAVQGKKLFINYLGTKCFLEMESFLNSSEAESYHALLFPSKTENFSYTILEAMTVGIPPLISDQTPWRNLEEKGVGWDLSLNEASKWVNALSELANESPDVRRKRKQNLNAFLHQWLKNNQAMYRELFGDL